MCKRSPASYSAPSVDVNALQRLRNTLQGRLQVLAQIIMSVGNRISAMSSTLETLKQQVLDDDNSYTDEKWQGRLDAINVQFEELAAIQALLDPVRAAYAQMVRDLDALATLSLALTAREVGK